MFNLGIFSNPESRKKGISEPKKVLLGTIAIVVLFAVTVYFVYYAPVGTDKLYCVVLFFLFWYSKSDYFWFAFFLIISAFPGGFFLEMSGTALRRLPVFSPIPKISFSVMDIFLIIALIKAIIRGKKTKLIDVFRLKNIAILIPYIIIVSVFYGVSLKAFLNGTARGFFFYTLLFSFPALIYNRKEIYKFMVLFFPFAILEIMAQIFTLKTGMEFATVFHSGAASEILNSVTGEIRAIPSGYINIRLAYVFAFVLLESKENIVPKLYSYLIILISLSSVIISATRSAIIMYIFIFIAYFVFIARKKPNVFLQIFISSAVFIMLLDTFNVLDLNNILDSSYNRFVGAVSMEDGSVKAEDTFDNRISNRLPILWDNIKKSILIGYGFSDKYFNIYDGHLGGVFVGLLQAGVFGYSLYVIFIINIYRKCFWYIKKIPKDSSFYGIIKVFTLSFIGYMIVNLSVDPIFVLNSFTVPQDVFIHLVIASLFINMAVREQILKKIEQRKAIVAVA